MTLFDLPPIEPSRGRGPTSRPGGDGTGPGGPIPDDEAPYTDAPAEIVAAMSGTVPTMQQWRAISHPLEPLSIIAGAGSGKTAVMAARVVYLALATSGRFGSDVPGVPPSRVLCLTFTNKAAEELSRRVRTATDGLGLPEGEEATVLTYHAFAARLLDEHGLRAGLEPGSMLLSEAQKWQLARSLLEEMTFEHLEVRTLSSVIKKALGLADECSNHVVSPEDLVASCRELLADDEVQGDGKWVETLEERIELAGIVAAYRDRKREIGAIDYGDQIGLAVRLATEHPEVGEEFRERYGAILLDEYQDTNVAQARLLRALCPPGYPVTAVGDPDQNIYAWRGASLFNILRFGQDFPGLEGPAERRPLYVNFRSGSRILAVADEVIRAIPEEGRPGEKVLRPHPSRGEGRVLAFVAGDEREEARRIAEQIRAFLADRPRVQRSDPVGDTGRDGVAGDEPAWHDVAVLCRKRRLFAAISTVLREEGIPVEVVDLSGLLKLPEVVDVTAWLRVLEDPARNVPLARILEGPPWRIGYRDLAALARWAAERNRKLAERLPEEDERPGDVVFALAESLDHLDEVEGLSADARERLERFVALFRELREEARGPLGDLVANVVERTGLLRELESNVSADAVSSRRNLLNLIDHVASFSPVEGEASLSTLVSWLDAAEEAEDELEPAQPSEANTVKLLTIHKAKGLEWPAVFVPGMAEHGRGGSSIFPDTSRQANPITQPQTLPFELRGDREVLPAYGGKLNPFRDALKERGLEDERRLAYVALTRARDLLVVSAAYWYAGPAEPHGPGTFFSQVAGSPACESLPFAEPPVESPVLEFRRSRAVSWPPAARPDDRDEVFPDGWRDAAVRAVADPGWAAERATTLGAGPRATFEEALAADGERASLIAARTRTDRPAVAPGSLSVTGLIDYEGCPQRFYWSDVRPLPRRPNPAARLGSEVHARIERESRGQATLDLDDVPDLAPEERFADPAREAELLANFRASRFAQAPPLYAERPFALYVDGVVVRGKIDAIFGEPDGPWEVVDYKTGRVPSADDPLLGLQLDVYALACVEVWHKRPEDLRLSYFYLATGEEVSVPASDPGSIRERITAALRRIAGGAFDAAPARHCTWCDFRRFCPPGQAWVASHPEPAREP